MSSFNQRIESLDPTLFNKIPSETSYNDRNSLLLLQRWVRDFGSYAYLEIGSHIGGTIQPYYIDPLCKLIYSIDKRPLIQPDERDRLYEYTNNSSEKMMSCLTTTFPSINAKKIRVFDCDASSIKHSLIDEKPKLCFIDGEHTNSAVYSDFRFCIEVCHPISIIAFHDAWIIYKGLEKIEEYLSNKSVNFEGIMLGGDVYAILLNEAAEIYSEKLQSFSQNNFEYFKRARYSMLKVRLKSIVPESIRRSIRQFKKSIR